MNFSSLKCLSHKCNFLQFQTDWSEWWLVSVQTFHVLMFCLVIVSHRANWHLLSAVTFLFLLTLMYFAQTINTLAAQNYDQFTKEQYFDSDGLFITLILLLPCALNCILFIVSNVENRRNVKVKLNPSVLDSLYVIHLLYEFLTSDQ
jgi:hypothetical protein